MQRAQQSICTALAVGTMALAFTAIGAWSASLGKPGNDASAADKTAVTIDSFPRAESDMYMGAAVKKGALGKFVHNREPTPIDDQTVIRMNRDTLYSTAVFDLDAGPVTIRLPDAGKRFMSLQVIDEGHFVPMVVYAPSGVTLSKDNIDTRYVMAAVRTLVDPSNPDDIKEVHTLQDAIKIEQEGAAEGEFEVPPWDELTQTEIRDALLALAKHSDGFRNAFGTREQVDPVSHLIGTASGWGGNPDKDARYLSFSPKENDGATPYVLSVKDVPVDGFWSISVYNVGGYFEKNSLNAYSLNNITAEKSADGSVRVQFGECDGKVPNCLPITSGWNYTVRLYRPQAEILDGRWTFPEAQPLSSGGAAEGEGAGTGEKGR